LAAAERLQIFAKNIIFRWSDRDSCGVIGEAFIAVGTSQVALPDQIWQTTQVRLIVTKEAVKLNCRASVTIGMAAFLGLITEMGLSYAASRNYRDDRGFIARLSALLYSEK